MHFDDFLTQLANHLELSSLEANELGVARLVLNESLVIDLERPPENEQTIYIHAVVGNLPTEQTEAWHRRLLGANLFSPETGGAALALDDSTDEIILCRVYPLDGLQFDAFAVAFEHFARSLAYWQEILSRPLDQEDEAPARGAEEAADPPAGPDLTQSFNIRA